MSSKKSKNHSSSSAAAAAPSPYTPPALSKPPAPTAAAARPKQWRCDVCRTALFPFEDYDKAVVHENACAIIAKQKKEKEKAGRRNGKPTVRKKEKRRDDDERESDAAKDGGDRGAASATGSGNMDPNTSDASNESNRVANHAATLSSTRAAAVASEKKATSLPSKTAAASSSSSAVSTPAALACLSGGTKMTTIGSKSASAAKKAVSKKKREEVPTPPRKTAGCIDSGGSDAIIMTQGTADRHASRHASRGTSLEDKKGDVQEKMIDGKMEGGNDKERAIDPLRSRAHRRSSSLGRFDNVQKSKLDNSSNNIHVNTSSNKGAHHMRSSSFGNKHKQQQRTSIVHLPDNNLYATKATKETSKSNSSNAKQTGAMQQQQGKLDTVSEAEGEKEKGGGGVPSTITVPGKKAAKAKKLKPKPNPIKDSDKENSSQSSNNKGKHYWQCDICLKAVFKEYDEAVAHEQQCTGGKQKKSNKLNEVEAEEAIKVGSLVMVQDRKKAKGGLRFGGKAHVHHITLSKTAHGEECVKYDVSYTEGGYENGIEAQYVMLESSSAKNDKWACDVCNVATFESYEEAVAHEESCQVGQKDGGAKEAEMQKDEPQSLMPTKVASPKQPPELQAQVIVKPTADRSPQKEQIVEVEKQPKKAQLVSINSSISSHTASSSVSNSTSGASSVNTICGKKIRLNENPVVQDTSLPANVAAKATGKSASDVEESSTVIRKESNTEPPLESSNNGTATKPIAQHHSVVPTYDVKDVPEKKKEAERQAKGRNEVIKHILPNIEEESHVQERRTKRKHDDLEVCHAEHEKKKAKHRNEKRTERVEAEDDSHFKNNAEDDARPEAEVNNVRVGGAPQLLKEPVQSTTQKHAVPSYDVEGAMQFGTQPEEEEDFGGDVGGFDIEGTDDAAAEGAECVERLLSSPLGENKDDSAQSARRAEKKKKSETAKECSTPGKQEQASAKKPAQQASLQNHPRSAHTSETIAESGQHSNSPGGKSSKERRFQRRLMERQLAKDAEKKGYSQSQRQSKKAAANADGGSWVVRSKAVASGNGKNDRTCLLDAVSKYDPRKSLRMAMEDAMPAEGDTSLAHIKEALASHDLTLTSVTAQYNKKGGHAFHLFQEHHCTQVLQLKLINQEGEEMNHYVAFDGQAILDHPHKIMLNKISDRKSPKSAKAVFDKLYKEQGGFKSVQIRRVFRLDVLQNGNTSLVYAIPALVPEENRESIQQTLISCIAREGDTSILDVSHKLGLQGMQLEVVSGEYFKEGGPPEYHLLQEHDCKLIINFQLKGQEGSIISHFVAWDGRVLYNISNRSEPNDTTDRTKDGCRGPFNKLFNTGNVDWRINMVHRLVRK